MRPGLSAIAQLPSGLGSKIQGLGLGSGSELNPRVEVQDFGLSEAILTLSSPAAGRPAPDTGFSAKRRLRGAGSKPPKKKCPS